MLGGIWPQVGMEEQLPVPADTGTLEGRSHFDMRTFWTKPVELKSLRAIFEKRLESAERD